ncbi:hypothetical protein BDV23DRAFT_157911 [Aspergillus alliaceus]|uniref:Uncharacterized protein n=1 Tax=Petromyces alliaceus TaxID=209559 RepID=A0A5N7C4I6_PETAA|nr:hypothetical protein BDV23DRAFT_157911 [Aspergillus alliaceus]
MAKKAKNARKDLLGPDNEETLRSSEMIGLACNLGDQWKKAEELQGQVMEIHKRVLGLEYPDTLTSMANLAPALMSSG